MERADAVILPRLLQTTRHAPPCWPSAAMPPRRCAPRPDADPMQMPRHHRCARVKMRADTPPRLSLIHATRRLRAAARFLLQKMLQQHMASLTCLMTPDRASETLSPRRQREEPPTCREEKKTACFCFGVCRMSRQLMLRAGAAFSPPLFFASRARRDVMVREAARYASTARKDVVFTQCYMRVRGARVRKAQAAA